MSVFLNRYKSNYNLLQALEKTMLETEKRPKTKRGEATRKKILAAAESEIGSKGFSEASISSITTAAGVGQGTFYIYFNSKEEVLRALVQESSKSMRQYLTEATANAATRLEKERAGLKAFIASVRKNPNLYHVVHESRFVDNEIYKEYYQSFANGYVKRLDEACDSGEIALEDTEACSWALMGMGEFLGYRYGILDKKAPLDPVVDTVFSMIENGMKVKNE